LINLLQERPELAAPLTSAGLSLEVLMEVVGAEERKVTVKTSTQDLKIKADQRKEANAKALEEIQDRLDKMAEQEKLSVFAKIFKYIGMVVGAIAAVATVVAGALTANPLMVVAGVMMGVMVVDSIVSEASDGKYSISAGVAALAEKCGASEDTAKWIGFGATMLMVVATTALSFGSSFAGSASQLTGQLGSILAKVQQVSSLINGINAIGTGATQIADAAFGYQVSQSQARTKDLEAVLERLRQATETEEEFLKYVVEKFEKMISSVSDVIQKNNEAQLQIQAADVPAMA
jgi:hypothetical protein